MFKFTVEFTKKQVYRVYSVQLVYSLCLLVESVKSSQVTSHKSVRKRLWRLRSRRLVLFNTQLKMGDVNGFVEDASWFRLRRFVEGTCRRRLKPREGSPWLFKWVKTLWRQTSPRATLLFLFVSEWWVYHISKITFKFSRWLWQFQSINQSINLFDYWLLIDSIDYTITILYTILYYYIYLFIELKCNDVECWCNCNCNCKTIDNDSWQWDLTRLDNDKDSTRLIRFNWFNCSN